MTRTKTDTAHVMDASISTATVDIQVMRIGTKQMTLAVFRQLPHLNIFDDDGRLLGSPWGWVNYDREEYSDAKPFIFSHEGVLYRSNVSIDAHNGLTVVASISCQKLKTSHWEVYRYVNDMRVLHEGWRIVSKRDGYGGPVAGYFTSEEGARKHLANRLESVAILEDAPQLFIGV